MAIRNATRLRQLRAMFAKLAEQGGGAIKKNKGKSALIGGVTAAAGLKANSNRRTRKRNREGNKLFQGVVSNKTLRKRMDAGHGVIVRNPKTKRTFFYTKKDGRYQGRYLGKKSEGGFSKIVSEANGKRYRN